MWSETGFAENSNLQTTGYGTKGFSNAEGIVVITGANYVFMGSPYGMGSGFPTDDNAQVTSAPCRVIVTYNGKATNA
jgi:hypothetical protein